MSELRYVVAIKKTGGRKGDRTLWYWQRKGFGISRLSDDELARSIEAKRLNESADKERPSDRRGPQQKRFMAKVAVDDSGCWIWNGAVCGGYGRFRTATQRLAHRTSYEMFVGPIPNDLQLDHICNNRACVNPTHLEPVTCKENIQRAWARKRTPGG